MQDKYDGKVATVEEYQKSLASKTELEKGLAMSHRENNKRSTELTRELQESVSANSKKVGYMAKDLGELKESTEKSFSSQRTAIQETTSKVDALEIMLNKLRDEGEEKGKADHEFNRLVHGGFYSDLHGVKGAVGYLQYNDANNTRRIASLEAENERLKAELTKNEKLKDKQRAHLIEDSVKPSGKGKKRLGPTEGRVCVIRQGQKSTSKPRIALSLTAWI